MLLQLPSKALQKRTQASRGPELTDPPPNLKSLEVDMVDQYGTTALHLATQYGAPKTVKLLLDHGADATRIDIWEGSSYLDHAIEGTQALQDGQDRGRYEDVLNLLMPVVGKRTLLKRACSGAADGHECGALGREKIVCDYVSKMIELEKKMPELEKKMPELEKEMLELEKKIKEKTVRKNHVSAVRITDRVFSALAMASSNTSIGNSGQQGGRSMAKGMRSNDQEPPVSVYEPSLDISTDSSRLTKDAVKANTI